MSTRLGRGVRLLVRAPDWLGDLAMAEPALRAIAERAGELDGSLTIAGSPRLLELLDCAAEPLASARRVDAADASSWRDHDLALLFVNSFRAAWIAARAGIPRRVGYSRGARAWSLTDSIAPAREVGRTPVGLGIHGRWPRALPRPFGATCAELAMQIGVIVRDPRPRFAPTAREREACERRLRGFGLEASEPFVLASVGSRPGSAKGYPAELWARAIEELAASGGLPILLACGPGEEAALRDVRAVLSAARPFACVDPVAGLRELVALCAAARAVLTADNGVRHVANAVGAPLAVLCGPTDPRHTADHLARTTLLRVPVACGPCHRERCPLSGAAHHACMRSIDPARLAAAARVASMRPR